MLIHRGSHKVGRGTYWNISNGQRIEVGGEDTLPGDSHAVYIKMSGAMMLLAGPVLGLMYAVFLPFIGIAMTLGLIGKKLFSGVAKTVVKSTTFGWRPIEAYLDGKKKRKKESKETKKNGKM